LPVIIAKFPEPSIMVLAGAKTDDDLELSPDDPIRQRIVNLKILSDMPALFSAADVMILPSIREGLPLVILESIACGCPVVASDLPGIRAVATHLPDVSLVPNGASADDIVVIIQKAITQKRCPDDMRESLVAAHLSLEQSISRWVVLCDQNP
jgi:glycosyltransferase involved in cell wall biosynthesis